MSVAVDKKRKNMKTKLNYDKILESANSIYKQEKFGTHPYSAPELFPDIRSGQVKAILKALVDAINEANGPEIV